jgi:DNA-binding CsgD family transcriptional regulator
VKTTSVQNFNQVSLLSGLFEEFIDGILILTDQGKWVQANACAHRICNQLLQGASQPNLVPEEIRRICQFLNESSISILQEKIVIESEISMDKAAGFRIRVQWLRLEETQHPYLVVIIEDRAQSLQNSVNFEARKYKLTPSEEKVWLLRRANYTYKEIANNLQITVNTVKKHLKNIHAKQKAILNIEQ